MTDPHLEVRFWKKVKKTPNCWLWTGATAGRGIGRRGHIYSHRDGSRQFNEYAHRVSWMIHFGEIPTDLCVLHSCDNGMCVRPGHLFLGTQIDNIKDMDSKGRRKSFRGEKHPLAGLTESQVLAIREAEGLLSQEVIARIAGTSRGAVNSILQGKTWKHLLQENCIAEL